MGPEGPREEGDDVRQEVVCNGRTIPTDKVQSVLSPCSENNRLLSLQDPNSLLPGKDGTNFWGTYQKTTGPLDRPRRYLSYPEFSNDFGWDSQIFWTK